MNFLWKCKNIDQLEFLIRILCQKHQHERWLIGKVCDIFMEVQEDWSIGILCQKCQRERWLIGKVREFFTEMQEDWSIEILIPNLYKKYERDSKFCQF